MEEGLMKILKELKAIRPEEGFVRRSRQIILASSQARRGFLGLKISIFESFRLAAAVTLASALLFVVFGGLSLFNVKNLSPMILSSLNNESLKAEEQKLDFQIQLGEVTYKLGEDKETAAKIDEILKDLSL